MFSLRTGSPQTAEPSPPQRPGSAAVMDGVLSAGPLVRQAAARPEHRRRALPLMLSGREWLAGILPSPPGSLPWCRATTLSRKELRGYLRV